MKNFTTKANRRNFFFLSVILLAHTLILGYSALIHSPTNGEVPALSSGVYHLSTGRFDLFRVNPPLVRCVATTPLLAFQPKTDWSKHRDTLTGRDEFPIGSDFIRNNAPKSFFYFTIARLACIRAISDLSRSFSARSRRVSHSRPSGQMEEFSITIRAIVMA